MLERVISDEVVSFQGYLETRLKLDISEVWERRGGCSCARCCQCGLIGMWSCVGTRGRMEGWGGGGGGGGGEGDRREMDRKEDEWRGGGIGGEG